MDKQIVICIAREYGSAGHTIGEELAKRLGIKFYDRNLLEEIALGKDVDHARLAKYDEAPKNFITTRYVRGHSNSPEENVAYLQFDFMKKQVDEGKSFVVVGRCADSILKGKNHVVTIFIMGDYEAKLERIMKVNQMSAKEAAAEITKKDKARRTYHNHYSDFKWGDSRNYDICLNTSKIGVDGAIATIEKFLENIS